MAKLLTQTLGDDEWVDPFIAQRAELMRRLQEPAKPAFTPEQAAERTAQNKREHDLGILGALSGDESLGNVGGVLLKQSLANRQPRMSERGTLNPLTGEFTYSPEYLRAQQQAQLDKLDTGSTASRESFERERRAARDKRELQDARYADMRILKSMGGGAGDGLGGGAAPQVGVDDAGNMVYRHTKTGRLFKYDQGGEPVAHTGRLFPKPSSANATEDERKAAGWVAQAEYAMGNAADALRKSGGSAAQMGKLERVAGFVPGVGEDLANAARDPQRQRFVQAAKSFAEAALRAATGAGVNEEEARQKVAELTPQLNDSPEVLTQKREAWAVYLASLKARAGRALQPGGLGGGGATGSWGDAPAGAPGGGAPGAAADPLGLRKPQ